MLANTLVKLVFSIIATSIGVLADDAADFGSTQQIAGNMERTDIDFVDGFAVDLFSPKNRTFVVTQNKNALDGKFVVGTTGENFQAILPYSYVLTLNESATDLIAKVELPYDPALLISNGFDPSDTYVGKLAPNGKSWVILENTRNIHKSENKTRIIKMTELEGEYLLLGRRDIDSSNIFVQYGQGETRTANFSGGAGTQEAEFIDGLRFSVQTDGPLRMNVDIKSPVETNMVTGDMRLLYSFSYLINTTAATAKQAPAPVPPQNLLPPVEDSTPTSASQGMLPSNTASATSTSEPLTLVPASSGQAKKHRRSTSAAVQNATIDFPINVALLRQVANTMRNTASFQKSESDEMEDIQLTVARRDLGAVNTPFEPMTDSVSLKNADSKVQMHHTGPLDGEYVVLVTMIDTPERSKPVKQGVASKASVNWSSVQHNLALLLTLGIIYVASDVLLCLF